MKQEIYIRKLEMSDCKTISDAFRDQGWKKPIEQYWRYFDEQEKETRSILVAFCGDTFAGYTTIVAESNYLPFKEKSIPEIVDFNVLLKFQRQNIGTKLMDKAEDLISEISNTAGIGVGLFSDYGNAQRLYVKRGYVPDGRGIFQNGRYLKFADKIIVNDGLVLYFTKKLN